MKYEGIRHPKTFKLARQLDVPHPHAVGTLEMLWGFTSKYAKDGDLSRFDAEDIAQAVDWTGDPRQLIDALTASGYLDDGTQVHDWLDHCPEWVKRQVRQRRTTVQPTSNNGSTNVVPSQSESQSESYTQPREDPEEGANAPSCPSGDGRGEVLPERERLFLDFWSAYPRKLQKKAARRAWARMKIAECRAAVPAVTAQLAPGAQLNLESRTDEQGKCFVPYPATWLNAGRWDDEIEYVQRYESKAQNRTRRNLGVVMRFAKENT